MKYAVPILSWVICVPVSFWFVFAWSFSGMDRGSGYMDASGYLWTAVPAMILGTCLIARPSKPMRWFLCGISALPWSVFPWLAVITFVPHGESDQWFALAKVLGFRFVICLGVPLILRVLHLQQVSHPVAPPE
jgi:hypothetical protein